MTSPEGNCVTSNTVPAALDGRAAPCCHGSCRGSCLRSRPARERAAAACSALAWFSACVSASARAACCMHAALLVELLLFALELLAERVRLRLGFRFRLLRLRLFRFFLLFFFFFLHRDFGFGSGFRFGLRLYLRAGLGSGFGLGSWLSGRWLG